MKDFSFAQNSTTSELGSEPLRYKIGHRILVIPNRDTSTDGLPKGDDILLWSLVAARTNFSLQ